MPALQVRDLPQNVYDALSASAERDHRSLAQQTTYILEQYLMGDGRRFHAEPRAPLAPSFETDEEIAARAERKRQVFARIEARGPLRVPDDFPDVVELIREGREERDARIGL